jgi:hypothetical protein
MVTILVVTQIIRITQNHIQLTQQRKEIEKTLNWIKDNDISEKDFEIQRKVFYLLYDELMKRKDNAYFDTASMVRD